MAASVKQARFAPDTALQRRIAATALGLGLLYAGLVAALLLEGTAGWLIALGAIGLAALQVRGAEELALRTVGAQRCGAETEPGLHALVERLCVQGDLPKPHLALSDTGAPTALAVSGLRGRPTVCVDKALLELLDPAELEGVVAHELAHIAHRDIVVMTIASFFSLVAALLVKLGTYVNVGPLRGIAWGAAAVVWAASFLLLRSLSRARELAADRTAAAMTGRPSALGSALMKVDRALAGIPSEDLRSLAPVAALAFAPVPARHWWGRLVATHPETARRIAALGAMEADLQTAAPLR